MSCEHCGRPSQADGTPTHFLGCEVVSLKAKVAEVKGRPRSVVTEEAPSGQCEHPDCSAPKKVWSGKGARPKFCTEGHKKVKE